jgi:hypothetical protein
MSYRAAGQLTGPEAGTQRRTDILFLALMPLVAATLARQPFDTMTGLALASCALVFLMSAWNLWRQRPAPDG